MTGMRAEIVNNPIRPAPVELLAQIVALEVLHMAFDGSIRDVIIEVNRSVREEVLSFFTLAFELTFPIEKVVRSSDEPYFWDDARLMSENATAGFNYRTIADTDRVSLHGYGRAFDVNTRLNPYIRIIDSLEVVEPKGATWNPNVPGTLYAAHPLVLHMESLGWSWGGNWDPKVHRAIDYQHFEKALVA